MNAEGYTKKFSLVPHPEGGMYKEVYRSSLMMPQELLPSKYIQAHSVSTSILFLLNENDFSAFHKITSDEIWHYSAGDGAIIYCISQDGKLTELRLSNDDDPASLVQVIIPAETWFAAETINKKSFILTGCTVAPGFEFSDFTLAVRNELIDLFPQHTELITRLTRNNS